MDKKTLRKILVGKPSLRRLIRSTIIIYGCLLVFAFGWSDRIIFRPHPASYQDSPEIIKIDSGSGQTVSAQYLVNAEADYTVLYNHGNAVDLGDMREFMEQIAATASLCSHTITAGMAPLLDDRPPATRAEMLKQS